MTVIDIINRSPYGLLFVNYSLLLSAAGGIIIMWMIFNYESDKKKDNLALVVAFTLAVGGVLNVLAEVNQPGRMINVLIYGWSNWGTSIIKYGVLFVIIFFVTLILVIIPKKFKYIKVIKALLFISALFFTAYSGIFMMHERGVNLWNTSMVPIFTTITGIAMGGFIFEMVKDRDKNDYSLKLSSYVGFGFTILSLIIFLLIYWWGNFNARLGVKSTFTLLDREYKVMLILSLITLIIPIVLVVMKKRTKASLIINIVSTVIYSYLIRYLIVAGGEGISRSDSGMVKMSPTLEEYYYTIISIIFMLGVLPLGILIIEKFKSKHVKEYV